MVACSYICSHFLNSLHWQHIFYLSFDWFTEISISLWLTSQSNHFGLAFHTSKLKTAPLCNIHVGHCQMRKKTTDMLLHVFFKSFWGAYSSLQLGDPWRNMVERYKERGWERNLSNSVKGAVSQGFCCFRSILCWTHYFET